LIDQREIRVDIDRDLAWVTLDMPPRNLLDAERTGLLADTLQRLDADESVGAVALTGAGDNFCTGVDIPKVVKTGTVQAFADEAVRLFGHFTRARKPILAAINGDALAGGFGVLCSADIVIAADHVQMGTIEASMGTWPALAKVPGLRRVPPKAMITNCLTGVPFTAQRAWELNIVDEVVPFDQLRARVRAYADLVVRGGSAAQAGRPLFYRAAALPTEDALRECAEAFISNFG
jgi:enoyl-CoA hydratase/carnithine racemase